MLPNTPLQYKLFILSESTVTRSGEIPVQLAAISFLAGVAYAAIPVRVDYNGGDPSKKTWRTASSRIERIFGFLQHLRIGRAR